MRNLEVVNFVDPDKAAEAARPSSPWLADQLAASRIEQQAAFNYVAFADEVAVGSLKLVVRHVMDDRTRIASLTTTPQFRRKQDEAGEIANGLLDGAELTGRLVSIGTFAYLGTIQQFEGLLRERGYEPGVIDRRAALEKSFRTK